ncbi:hypothetical protein SLEP1_g9619 [Rubroshorea leprosula]|uniref:Protein NUCLEAR FUSION DEFECTIVE 6, chloroplastic/mitochondrial-like n=1 Tax=Rubroshorea leprosula TaxID=152421 RepID=A0AAV5I5G5_9ROSI|nr:hypothetical protein SLEP1_g9619 [Rubroshorea leprosula]
MASLSAARSILRSNSVRNAAARLAQQDKSKSAPYAFRPSSTSKTSVTSRTFRCPVEASFCLESMLPYHTVTASALMTSMLSISRNSPAWLPEAI